MKSSPVFSVTATNFCDLICQWLRRHALKVLYSLLSANTQNPYKSVLIRIQCVFNIIAVLRTNRVLHEICIEIKVSVSDFLRGATKIWQGNYNHHFSIFTQDIVKFLDSYTMWPTAWIALYTPVYSTFLGVERGTTNTLHSSLKRDFTDSLYISISYDKKGLYRYCIESV